ncbi:GNAT family N-acetyltransferase [Euzebya tangerina]|uniref:GNAT family N-acetyltransferase n=1 Tax=Euzebya tangerina TaxID=591198 RepID=UPI000E322BCF|nr:GNAT family N-acetyltransferase [Euzebya tangerina]
MSTEETKTTSPSANGRPWLPADFVHPVHVPLPAADGSGPTGLHLRPIRAADTEIDHPAVMGSQARLWSIYGEAWGWPPPTMTVEADREDLARHEAEIAAHESFNYALLDEGETELLGCLYIDPPVRPGTDAEISWWVVDRCVGTEVEAALDAFVPVWVANAWPLAAPHLGPPTP